MVFRNANLEIQTEKCLIEKIKPDYIICYDDLIDYLKLRDINSIITITNIYRIGHDINERSYKDLFDELKDHCKDSLIIIPLFKFKSYKDKNIIENLCTNIDQNQDYIFYPFSQYCRYVYYNPRSNLDNDTLLEMSRKSKLKIAFKKITEKLKDDIEDYNYIKNLLNEKHSIHEVEINSNTNSYNIYFDNDKKDKLEISMNDIIEAYALKNNI